MSSRTQRPTDTLDGCKRVFKGIVEAARQLETKQLKCSSCVALFSPELVAQRVKIADLAANLALREPKVFGRKCEDIVWRKVFHGAYAQAKQLRRSATSETSGPLTRHLAAGVGFYHSFVQEIQAQFHVANLALDFSTADRDSQLSTQQSRIKIHDAGTTEWAKGAVHRSLIALGDLHRYLSVLSPNNWSDNQAARFYMMASHFDPTSSMPFNQLGTLASAKGKSIDATLYYLRCLTSETPFEGAEANLRQVLKQHQNDPFLKKFLNLVYAWWFTENTTDVNMMSEECLAEFKHVLGPQAVENGSLMYNLTNMGNICLNSELLVKLISICLVSSNHLKNKSATHSPSVIIFVLNFFNLLTSKLVEGSRPIEEKKVVKKKKIRRRRKKRFGNESSESDDEDGGSISSEQSSESEESAESSSEGSSSDSEEPEVNPLLKSQDLAALGAIKLCCDWLQADMEVLKLFSANCRAYMDDLVKLLNILNLDCKMLIKAMRLRDGFQSILEVSEQCSLPEDAVLRNHRVVNQTKLNWKLFNSNPYKSDILLRLCKLVNFGMFLASCPEVSGLRYNSESNKFALSAEVPIQANNIKKGTPQKLDKDQQKKLMQSMGQLWLQEEVRNLESRVSRSQDSCVSPYLVLDSSAILLHLHQVKQLAVSKKFVIIVPIIVLEGLDEIKKEDARAREAIRWLENQFHKGNRFLRAQRTNEALAIPLIKCPKKKEKDTWTFFQILECCNFLSQQQQQMKSGSQDAQSNLVTFVTGVCENSSKDFSPVGLATSIGVNIESILDLAGKLKHTTKKKSIKREK